MADETRSDEGSLLDRAKAGDRAAFGEMVRANLPRVWRLALQLTGDRAAADDVTQEAFLRAQRALPKFDGRSAFFTWMYRITVNVALNRIRSEKRTSPVAEGDPRVVEINRSTVVSTRLRSSGVA